MWSIHFHIVDLQMTNESCVGVSVYYFGDNMSLNESRLFKSKETITDVKVLHTVTHSLGATAVIVLTIAATF